METKLSLPIFRRMLPLYYAWKEPVTKAWADEEQVKRVFALRGIPREHFREEYAGRIFDYLGQVVEGTTPIGSCPAMEEMIRFFYKKKINVPDIYLICASFRKSLFHTFFSSPEAEAMAGEQRVALMDEIANVMDANLAGVLNTYTETIYHLSIQLRKKVEEIREKDEIIVSQARQAAMGEIISAVAHHWRQPLTAVNMAISNVQVAIGLGETDLAEMEGSLQYAAENIQVLSRTIDEFRGLFAEDAVREETRLDRLMDESLETMGEPLMRGGFAVEKRYAPALPGKFASSETIQVLRKILTNAVETAGERKIAAPRLLLAVREDRKSTV